MTAIAAGYTSQKASLDQVADWAYGANFRGEGLVMAIAVAKAENQDLEIHGYLDNVPLGGRGKDRGLWAINDHWHSEVSDAVAYDPPQSAREVYRISAGGTDWSPWTTVDTGAHRRHLSAAQSAAESREAQGGAGSIAGSATPTATLSGDEFFTLPGVPVAYTPPRSHLDMWARGSGESAVIGEYVTGGSVDLTAGEVSEIQAQLVNEGWLFAGAGRGLVTVGGDLTWGPFEMEVSALEQRGGSGDGFVTVTGRPRKVQALRRTNTDQAGNAFEPAPDSLSRYVLSMRNISPTEYVREWANRVGLRYIGQGSPRRSDITQVKDDQGVYESPWEIIQRLARELGFWAFEAAGVLFFARPSFLLFTGVEVKVGWKNGWDHPNLEAVELPTFRRSLDSYYGQTITVKLPRWRGEFVRPGMRLALRGVATWPDNWMVTRVSWPIDNGLEPVTIEGVLAEDRVVKPTEPTTDVPAPAAPAPSTPSTSPPPERGERISQAQRIRDFGDPGDRSRTTQVETPWGITVTVHKDVASRFRTACEAAKSTGWTPHRIDSYAVRPIRGGDEWSLHSFGLAWDIFSSGPGVPPPGGVWAETSAPSPAFRQAFKDQGFYLGADFRNRKDYPHIEWAASRAAAVA